MSSESKEKRCKSCSKLLIDEKVFCKRCVLEGRNKVIQIGGIIVGGITTICSIESFINNTSDNDDVNNSNLV